MTTATVTWFPRSAILVDVRYLSIVLGLAACGGGNSSTDAGAHRDGTDPTGDGSTGDGSTAIDGPIHTGDADLSCANPGSIPPFAPRRIVTGLTQPVYLAQPPGSTDLYVVEKTGRIKLLRGGAVVGTFLDLSSKVLIEATDVEGGLLSLEFAKDYASSGRFWVYLSLPPASPLDKRAAVQEFHRSNANHDVADAAAVRELIATPYSGYSVGGTIKFGPDGYLWLATGDRATMPSVSPDKTDRGGKMLRIDVDDPATPPPNGLGGGGDAYVWDFGLRNPYRFTFDRVTHEAYIADPGDNQYEEVNIELPGVGHHDFGWDRAEGKHCRDGSTTCNPGTLPQYERPHASSFSVIIGGTVYRGEALPCLRGRYIFGIYGTGDILSWVWDGASITSETNLTDRFGSADLTMVTSIVDDQAGEIYLTTMDGNLFEIVPM